MDRPMIRLQGLEWYILPSERRKLFLFSDGLNIPLRDKKRGELIEDYIQNAIRHYSGDEYFTKWLNKMNDLIYAWDIDFVDVDNQLDEFYSTEF